MVSPWEVLHFAATQDVQQLFLTVLAVLFWLNGFEGVKCLDSTLAVYFRI